jgi:carboxypeptidase D
MHSDKVLRAVGLVLLLTWFSIGSAHARSGPGKGAGPRTGKISKVVVTIAGRGELERLAGYDIDHVAGSNVVLYADSDEVNSLTADGWKLEILQAPAPGPIIPRPRGLGAYNNYSNMTAMLDNYAASFPSVCRKISLGKSVQNRELWALKITSNPDQPADKPKFKYISTMHGNEPVGTEMCLYLIDLLLRGYATNDARVSNLVNNVEIWFLPLMNPDGRESNPPQRYNANGYDLNRSFPEGSGTDYGNQLYGPANATNTLPIEVRGVMAWTAAHHFTLGANFHTGSTVANYPYDDDNIGSVNSPTPDDALLRAFSLTYSSNNPPMFNSAYFSQGIVNGAAWYVVAGGMQDWNYRYEGCFDLTIELADYQWPDPPGSQLPTYWSQNRESMLSYMEWVLRGVRGVTRDAMTGQPVRAAVRVEGAHHLVFSDPSVGNYHRILLPGTYNIWFYAPGYMPQRIPNVVVGAGAAARIDVSMQPVSARFSAKVNFQPATAAIPTGFVADSGAAFGPRTGGYSYGWESALAAGNLLERRAGRSQDLRYDTLCQMQGGGSHTWEIAVPNGPYAVALIAGDPSYATGTYRVTVENTLALDGTPNSADCWVESVSRVLITDGRLTLANAAGAISNRLASVEISAVEPMTMDEWRALYFGTTGNSGPAADGADPDGDGIPNLLEYALGLDPAVPDSQAQLTPVYIQTNGVAWFGCSFLRNTNATDLELSLQVANDVGSPGWTNLATRTNASGWFGPGLSSEVPGPVNCVMVTVMDAQPIDQGGDRFIRLRVRRL